MQMTLKVTLLVVPVLCVASFWAPRAQALPLKTNKVVVRADQVAKEMQPQIEPTFAVAFQASRNVSLYDHEDGSRSEGMDYLLAPQLKTSIGSFGAKLTYIQNLRDDTGHIYDGTTNATDWGDVPFTYSLVPNKWQWAYPYIITITPFATVIMPASQNSLKRDQLKTAFSIGTSFAVIPDGIAPVRDGAFSLAIGVTAGQNLHSYSTGITGKVLNKYSSNQTLNFGYTYKAVSLSLEFINKSRWTYEGSVTNSFVHTEEIGYAFNKHYSVAVGHTTGGTGLKANGLDSNLDFINENDSTIYGSLGISF